MNKALLIIIILGTTLGFILILAVMVYCTFRARHLARRSNFPVFVIPSPGQRERMDFRQDLEQGGHAGEIPGHHTNSFESIELKKYRRFTEGQFGDNEIKGIENPVFEPGPSTSKGYNSREPHQELESREDSCQRANDDAANRERIEISPQISQRPQPSPRSESSGPSPSHFRPRPSPSHDRGSPPHLSSPPALKSPLSKFPNDSLAVELEHRGQIRSRQLRMSQESFRRSQNLSMDASYDEMGPRSPSAAESSGKRDGDPEGMRPASWAPSPLIQSNYKLSRELAEVIASDRVAESSVMIDGALDPLSGSILRPTNESIRRRSQNSLSLLDPIQESEAVAGADRVSTPSSAVSLPFHPNSDISGPDILARTDENPRNSQRVELVFKQRTAV